MAAKHLNIKNNVAALISNITSVADATEMFKDSKGIALFGTSSSKLKFGNDNLRNATRTFASSSFTTIKLSQSKLTNATEMFKNCTSLTTLVTSIYVNGPVTSMFEGCTNLTSLGAMFGTSSTNIDYIIKGCKSLTSSSSAFTNGPRITSAVQACNGASQPTSTEDGAFGSLQNAEGMFGANIAITSASIGSSSLSDISNMFDGATNLTTVTFGTSQTTAPTMTGLFGYTASVYGTGPCNNLTTVNVNSLTTKAVVSAFINELPDHLSEKSTTYKINFSGITGTSDKQTLKYEANQKGWNLSGNLYVLTYWKNSDWEAVKDVAAETNDRGELVVISSGDWDGYPYVIWNSNTLSTSGDEISIG